VCAHPARGVVQINNVHIYYKPIVRADTLFFDSDASEQAVVLVFFNRNREKVRMGCTNEQVSHA
jgi:hypothetical protein